MASTYEPSAHAEHEVLPTEAATVPAAHGKQTAELVPAGVVLYRPSAQPVHVLAPATAYEPALHDAQRDDAAAPVYVPAAHGAHVAMLLALTAAL